MIKVSNTVIDLDSSHNQWLSDCGIEQPKIVQTTAGRFLVKSLQFSVVANSRFFRSTQFLDSHAISDNLVVIDDRSRSHEKSVKSSNLGKSLGIATIRLTR